MSALQAAKVAGPAGMVANPSIVPSQDNESTSSATALAAVSELEAFLRKEISELKSRIDQVECRVRGTTVTSGQLCRMERQIAEIAQRQEQQRTDLSQVVIEALELEQEARMEVASEVRDLRQRVMSAMKACHPAKLPIDDGLESEASTAVQSKSSVDAALSRDGVPPAVAVPLRALKEHAASLANGTPELLTGAHSYAVSTAASSLSIPVGSGTAAANGGGSFNLPVGSGVSQLLAGRGSSPTPSCSGASVAAAREGGAPEERGRRLSGSLVAATGLVGGMLANVPLAGLRNSSPVSSSGPSITTAAATSSGSAAGAAARASSTNSASTAHGQGTRGASGQASARPCLAKLMGGMAASSAPSVSAETASAHGATPVPSLPAMLQQRRSLRFNTTLTGTDAPTTQARNPSSPGATCRSGSHESVRSISTQGRGSISGASRRVGPGAFPQPPSRSQLGSTSSMSKLHNAANVAQAIPLDGANLFKHAGESFRTRSTIGVPSHTVDIGSLNLGGLGFRGERGRNEGTSPGRMQPVAVEGD